MRTIILIRSFHAYERIVICPWNEIVSSSLIETINLLQAYPKPTILQLKFLRVQYLRNHDWRIYKHSLQLLMVTWKVIRLEAIANRIFELEVSSSDRIFSWYVNGLALHTYLRRRVIKSLVLQPILLPSCSLHSCSKQVEQEGQDDMTWADGLKLRPGISALQFIIIFGLWESGWWTCAWPLIPRYIGGMPLMPRL